MKNLSSIYSHAYKNKLFAKLSAMSNMIAPDAEKVLVSLYH